jgi:hypothetical protein
VSLRRLCGSLDSDARWCYTHSVGVEVVVGYLAKWVVSRGAVVIDHAFTSALDALGRRAWARLTNEQRHELERRPRNKRTRRDAQQQIGYAMTQDQRLRQTSTS